MPVIYETSENYMYTDLSGVTLVFPKVDPPGIPDNMKAATMLASIRASDPEASTVEKYVPKDGVSLAAFKAHMVDLENGAMYERAETESAKWPAKVRIQWSNGQTIKLGDALYQALSSGGITEPILHALLTLAEKDT
jgi:hypothetical protein